MFNEFKFQKDAPVLVIGGAGMDVVGKLIDEIDPNSSNPAKLRTSYGGVARNVAENLARLGQPVTLLSVVGEDQVGNQLLTYLAQAGVNIDHILKCSDFPTGAYLAVLNSSGKVVMALDDMRVIENLTSEYLRSKAELFENASILFLDANLSKKTLRTAFSLARQAKMPVAADPTATSLAHRLAPYLDRLQLITPNEKEAAQLCHHTIEADKKIQVINAAKQLVGMGVKIVIITLAEFGVCYASSDVSGHIPAVRTDIVDPTGAGDALTATVIFSLLNQVPLDEAVRIGATAAALTLRHNGTVVSDLSLEKLYDELVI